MSWGINNRWVAIGQSNIGKSHLELGLPCQDNIKYICTKKGLYCALCDGLGSKKNSEKGSEYVSLKIAEFLQANFKIMFKCELDELREQIINQLRNGIIKDLKINDKNLDNFKTTLVFLAIKNGKYIVGSIGDSVVGLLKNGNAVYLSDSFDKKLEYANSTYTIFDDDAFKHLHIKKGYINDKFDSAFMISDGLPFFANSGKVAPKLIQYIDILCNTPCITISELMNKTLQKIVNSRESCIDDWSYVFVKKVNSDSIAKTYYTNIIKDK